MLKRAQDLQLKLRKRLNQRGRGLQRAPHCAEPAGQRHRLAVSDPGQNRSQDRKKKRPPDRLNILLFFYRKQFIQLKPIRAMTSELSDLIWGRCLWRSRALLAPRPL